MDSDFQATIALEAGKGTLAGIVREWATELRFKDVPINQTYVHAALHEFGQPPLRFRFADQPVASGPRRALPLGATCDDASLPQTRESGGVPAASEVATLARLERIGTLRRSSPTDDPREDRRVP